MNDFTDEKNLKKIYYGRTTKLQHRLDAWERFGTNKIKFFDWVALQLPELKGRFNILDAGCGTGRLLSRLGKKYKGAELYGVDISPAMVKATKLAVSKMNKRNILEADIKKLPFHSDYFAVVTATHVLYHVPDISGAIKELKRVLKPGGIIFITTTDYDLEQGLNKIHYEALRKLHFPKFMQDKNSYLRFPPIFASNVLKKYFPKVTTFKFRNDLVYTNANDCFGYYQTAMMYRNSRGVNDERVPAKLWQDLAKEVKGKIVKKIKKNGQLIVKGKVFGFKAYKA